MSDERVSSRHLLFAAVAAVGAMVGLILLSVVLFGEEAESGLLQVAMSFGLCAAMVTTTAMGHRMEELSGAMVRSITSALGTVFVMLAVGALIGSLFLSGTISTAVAYGAELGTPQIL